MKKISSRLTIVFKLVFLSKSILFLFFIFLSLFLGEIIFSIISLALSILLFLIARSVKTIHVLEDQIICRGFLSKSAFNKQELKKVEYVFQGIYFLKFNNDKKVFFLGTSKDSKNTWNDLSTMGKKEIEENIRN